MKRNPKQVKIPFHDEFRYRLLTGLKTATTRTRKFGNPGDTFPAYGTTFKIIMVIICNLSLVKLDYYRQEGFGAPAEFVECWKDIHPRNGWIPSQVVYLHLFERIGGKSERKADEQARIEFR